MPAPDESSHEPISLNSEMEPHALDSNGLLGLGAHDPSATTDNIDIQNFTEQDFGSFNIFQDLQSTLGDTTIPETMWPALDQDYTISLFSEPFM